MSNQADHTIVRLRVPPELKGKIEKAAEENNRSQSAEMVDRLEQSFHEEKAKKEGINEISNMFNRLIDENKALKEQNELYNAKMLKLLNSLVNDFKKT